MLRRTPPTIRLLALALLAAVGGCDSTRAGTPMDESEGELRDTTDRASPVDRVDSLPDSVRGLVTTHPWTVAEVGAPPPADGVVAIRSLETEAHGAFDRIVVTFEGERPPGYHVEYIDHPLHECGSGRAVYPPGEGWLQLRMTRARGHTDAGSATVPPRRETPELTGVVRIDRTCNFEGKVELVLSVEAPGPYRLSVAEAPTRLVLDVRGGGPDG